jgi:hypothetical protein
MTSLRRTTALAIIATALLAGCKDQTEAPQTTAATATATPVTTIVPPKVDGLVFTKGQLKVGQTADETNTMKMTMSITVDPGTGKPQTMNVDKTGSEKKSEKILATDGSAIQKLQVTYTEKTDVEKDDKGKETKRPSPLNGKTYVVEDKAGSHDITNDKGKTPPPVETTLVEKSYKMVGKPDPVMSAMPTRPLVVGQPVPELAKALEEVLDKEGGNMKISDLAVVLKEKSGDEGVFDVKATLTMTDGPMSFAMALTGDMHVRTADSQLTAMKMSGPVTITSTPDPKSKMKMDGKGTMEMTATRMYH